ncbi:MAG: hypothetical protein KAS32_30575 [Candidatus Peribacteraceae bacterium]|nr:hypothetical protein [Candidatus Peribacteraceae bacterium]
MASKPPVTPIKPGIKDPIKERLRELKRKPVLTPQENKEAIDKILDYLNIKE